MHLRDKPLPKAFALLGCVTLFAGCGESGKKKSLEDGNLPHPAPQVPPTPTGGVGNSWLDGQRHACSQRGENFEWHDGKCVEKASPPVNSWGDVPFAVKVFDASDHCDRGPVAWENCRPAGAVELDSTHHLPQSPMPLLWETIVANSSTCSVGDLGLSLSGGEQSTTLANGEAEVFVGLPRLKVARKVAVVADPLVSKSCRSTAVVVVLPAQGDFFGVVERLRTSGTHEEILALRGFIENRLSLLREIVARQEMQSSIAAHVMNLRLRNLEFYLGHLPVSVEASISSDLIPDLSFECGPNVAGLGMAAVLPWKASPNGVTSRYCKASMKPNVSGRTLKFLEVRSSSPQVTAVLSDVLEAVSVRHSPDSADFPETFELEFRYLDVAANTVIRGKKDIRRLATKAVLQEAFVPSEVLAGGFRWRQFPENLSSRHDAEGSLWLRPLESPVLRVTYRIPEGLALETTSYVGASLDLGASQNPCDTVSSLDGIPRLIKGEGKLDVAASLRESSADCSGALSDHLASAATTPLKAHFSVKFQEYRLEHSFSFRMPLDDAPEVRVTSGSDASGVVDSLVFTNLMPYAQSPVTLSLGLICKDSHRGVGSWSLTWRGLTLPIGGSVTLSRTEIGNRLEEHIPAEGSRSPLSCEVPLEIERAMAIEAPSENRRTVLADVVLESSGGRGLRAPQNPVR